MYVTISNNRVEFHDGIPSLEDMQRAVGGYVETADRFDAQSRKDRSIDVYCNEEGLFMGLPVSYINRHGNEIVGDLIMVTANTRSGNIVEGVKDDFLAVLRQMGHQV
jgi:hypothetical protein